MDIVLTQQKSPDGESDSGITKRDVEWLNNILRTR